MVDNKIFYISQQEAENKIKDFNARENIHVAVVDGHNAKTWKDYLSQIETLYQFPTTNDNFDGYADWLQDLSWLEKEAYALFIWDYDEFMSMDQNSKKIVMSIFLDQILPWWQHDVELYCVGGKSKEFNIYLVNINQK